ncbi:MAG: desulfoferrodoxin [Lachnospiraceae bacterium]|nr:desulfoferrodoxin [Lachnospiraceae bacterium]
MSVRYFKCETCGQLIAVLKKKPCPVMCCGKPMKEILPGTTDAAVEKHVPVYTVENNIVTVTVGSVAHPMLDVHYIEWIALETTNGYQKVDLTPGSAPVARFALLEGDTVEAVYAYCNLHGLWKA